MLHTNSTDVNKKVAQGAATRSTLIAAGRTHFGSNGFTDTSIDEIAATAQVSKGAFYHHFKGKEDLFRSVYEAVKREVTEQVAPSFVDLEPRDALIAGCLATIDAHLNAAVRRITLFDGRAVLGWEIAREVESRYGAVLLRGALRRAMHTGVIERQPLAPLAQMLNGAITEACLIIADAGDDDVERARGEIAQVLTRIFDGLRPGVTTPNDIRPQEK